MKYKYKPRVIDGEPVEVPGVRTIIRFELEK
jgi:protein TonB